MLETILILLFIYYSIRYGWFLRAISYNRARVLMYHMISNKKRGAKFNSLRVSPKSFERQIRYLKNSGFQSFTMSELMELNEIPKKSVVITFDDGYEDNYTNAYPILKKYGFKATIYLVINRENNNWSIQRKAKNSTNELVDEPKLQDSQILEMLKSGLIEVGSHTMNHLNFQKLTVDKTKMEIEESKKSIESKFNVKCKTFAYPFGIYKENDYKIVKELGFTSAVTTRVGIDDLKVTNRFLISRITVSGKDNFLAFRIKIKRAIRGVFK